MSVGFKMFSFMSSGLFSVSAFMWFMGLHSVGLGYSLVVEWEIFKLSSCLVSMSLVFDWMSFFFLGSVCLISSVIMKYCEYYMEGEVNFFRFSFILSLFVVSMLLLIVSPNLISLLLGWDGLGLTSYCLVIYYQNELSCNAGMLTILSNRVGDVAILLSIGLMFGQGSWDFYMVPHSMDWLVAGLVVLASFTKSAQLPFSAWLPAAMAAPTPVSALVHSSTLVTAGVYLLIRFSDALWSSGIMTMVFSVSCMTMFVSGLCAVFESDLKKVVALSTLSQLGLMIMTLSLGMKELAFFHLVAHAMFKSSLFLCVGFMIHSSSGSQDSRQMSSFGLSSPALGVMFSTTNLALCGFPFLAGFYSKDALLEHSWSVNMNSVLVWLIMASTGLTVAYSFRVLYFSVGKNSVSSSVSGLSDFNLVVVNSVSVLFLASLFIGFLVFWVALPLHEPVYLSTGQKYAIGLVSLLGGVGLYSLVWLSKSSVSSGLKVGEMYVSKLGFLKELSTKLFIKASLGEGLVSTKTLDSGWFEYYGGQGGRALLLGLSSGLQQGQFSSVVSMFLVTAFISLSVLLSFV